MIHRSVLLVDDDPDYHELFSEYLALCQFDFAVDIDSAESSAAALEMLENKDYDVVFVDYRLGAISGIEFIRGCHLRRIESPCVLLTGFDSPEADREALAVGAMDYLPKDDVSPNTLSRCIRYVQQAQYRRLELQDAVRLSQDAAHARAAFLGNMSHELRTPLNGVLGFADLILMDGAKDPETTTAYVRHIQESGHRLLELVEGLLQVSSTSSDIKLSKDRVSLGRFFEELCERYKTLAEARKISFKLEIRNPDSWIITDQRLLSLALRPLISNALKFTDEGGAVNIKVLLSEMLTVIVSDTGMGMDDETLANACAPFFQSDSGLEKRHEGAGIGLSMAKNSVSALSGSLVFDSELGKGTTVSITVPVKAQIAEMTPVDGRTIQCASQPISSRKNFDAQTVAAQRSMDTDRTKH